MKKKNRKVVISIIATLIVICTIIVSIFNNGIIETFANTYPTNLWNGNFDWDSQLIVDQHEVDYVYQGGKYLKYVKMSDINDLVSLNQSILQEEVNKNIDIELIIRIDDGYDLYLLSLYTSPLVTSNTQTSIQAYLSAHYVLGDDIDYAKGYPDRYKAFTPIGYADFDEIGDEEVIYPFTGIFDGQGFEIKGLNLAMYDDLFPEGNQEHYFTKWIYYTMFSYNQGTIRNLGIVDIEANLDYRPDNVSYASTLVGKNLSGGIVENVYVRDTRDAYLAGLYVAGGFKVGGIIAVNEGTFRNSYISATTVVHVYTLNSADFEPAVFDIATGTIENVYYDDIYGQELSQNDDYIFDEPSISDDIVKKVSHDDLINRNGVLQTSGWYTNNISRLKGTNLPTLQGDYFGLGTSSYDPYQIRNAVDLVNFPRLLSANPTKYQTAYFKVIENIDMRSVSKDAYIPSTTGFSGEFNGNYKIIKHLSLTTGILMSGQYLVGMFSNLNPGSLVKNVNLYKPLVKLNNTNEYYGSKLNLGIISAKMNLAEIDTITIDGVGLVNVNGNHFEGNRDKIIDLGSNYIGSFAVGSIVGYGTGDISKVSIYGDIDLGVHNFDRDNVNRPDITYVAGGIIGETIGVHESVCAPGDFSCLESQNKYISLYKVINHAKIIGIGFDNINGVNSTYQPVRIGGILGHGKIRGFERVSNHGEIYSTSEIASIYQVRIGGVFAEIIGFDGSSNLRHNIYNKGKLTIRNVTPYTDIQVAGIGVSNIQEKSLYQLLIMDSFDDNPIVVENNNDFDSFVYNLGIYNIGGAIELSRVYNFAAQNIITNLSEVLVSPIYYSKLNVSQKLSNVINYGFITIKEGNFTNIDIAGISLANYTNYDVVHNYGNITLGDIESTNITYSGSTLTISGISKTLNDHHFLTNSYNGGNINVYPFNGNYHLAISGIVYQNLSLISEGVEVVDNDTSLRNQIRLSGKSTTGVINVINHGNIFVRTNTTGSTLIGGIATYNYGLIQDAANLADLRCRNVNTNQTEGGIYTAAHENNTTGKVYIGGIAAIGGDTNNIGGRIFDAINSGNIYAETIYLAMAAGIVASTKTNQISIRYCINYGDIYAFATSGRNLPSFLNYRPAPAARSGGVIASGNSTITNVINHGIVASNDAAGGAIAVVENIQGINNSGVVISSMVNYGYIKSINSVSYSQFNSSDPLEEKINKYFSYAIVFDGDSVYSQRDTGFLLSIPRALGGFIGAIWPPGNYQDDYTAYEFILNTDSKVNLVGRVPLLEDLGVTDLPNVDTSRMYTTKQNDATQSPFSGVVRKINSNVENGIYHPNFSMRREKDLQNYIFYLPYDLLSDRFKNEKYIDEDNQEQFKFKHGMYVLANSAGREHGAILPVNVYISNLTPLVPHSEVNIIIQDNEWRDGMVEIMLPLHQNRYNHQTKLYDLVLSDNTWLNVEGGTVLEWDDVEGANYYYAYVYLQEFNEFGTLESSKLLSGYPRKVTSGLDLTELGLLPGKYKIEIQAIAKSDSNFRDSIKELASAEFEIFGVVPTYPDPTLKLVLTSTSVYWTGNKSNQYVAYIYPKNNPNKIITYTEFDEIEVDSQRNMYIINYNDLNLPYDSNNSSNNDYYISVQDITYSENSIPSKLSTSYSFTISESNVNEEDVTQLDTVEYDGEYISWNASVDLNYNVIIYDESGDTPIAFLNNVESPVNLLRLNLPIGTYQARLHTTTGYPGSNGDFRRYLTSDSYQFSINENTSTNLNEPGTISNYSETMSGLLPRFVSSINVSGANIDAYLLYVYQSDNIVTGYPLFLTSAQMSELTIRNLYLVGGDTELVDHTFRFVPLRSNTIDLGNRLITVYAVNRETPYRDQTIGITNRTWYILGYGDGNGRANANPSSYVDSVIESISVSFENVENATWYSLYVYDSNNNLVNGYPRPAKSNIINFNQLDLIEGEGYKLKVVANGDGCYSSPLGSSKELNFKVTNVPQSKVQNSKPIIYAKLDWDFSEQTDIPDNAYIETEEPIYDVKVIEYYHGLWRDDANAQYKIQYKYYSENGETYEWEDLTGPITITNPNLTFTSVNIPEYIETYRGIYIRFIAEGRTNRVILDDIKFLHDRSGLQKVNATKELINNTIKSTYNQNDVIILPNVGSFNTLINWIAIGDNSSRIDLEKGLFDKSEETYTITLIATIIDPLTQTTSELEKEIVVNPVMNYGRIGPVFDVENMEDVIPLASTGAKIDSSYLELTWSTSNVTSYNESGLTNGNYSLAIGSPLGTGHITSEFSLTNIGKINFSYGLYGTSSNVSYRISYSNNLDTWYEIVTESISNTNINNGQLYTKSINLPFNTSEGVYFRFETLSNGGLIIDDLSFEINEYEKLLQATTSLGNVFTINYNMFDVVTLWKHGSYESNINWRYSNGDYILDDFLYLDYDDEGYSINLTAELSINELTRSVDFVINVLELDKYLDLGNVYDGENFINEDILPSEGALLGAGSSQVTWKTLLAFGYNEDFGRYNGEYAIRIGNPAFIAYIYQEEIINGTTRDVLVHGYPREIIEGTGLDELNLPNGEYTISIVATDILNHPTALVSNSFKFTINDSYDDVRERLSVGVTRETRVLFEPLENADYYLAFIYDDQNKEISGSPFKITNGYDISTLKLPNGKYQIEIVGVAKLDEEYMDSLPSQRFEFYIFGSDVVFSEEKLNINSISFNNNTLNFSVDNITKDNALGYQIYAYKKDNNELRKITGSPYFVENNNTNNYAINLANVFPDGDYVFGVKAIGYDLESGYGEYKDSDILTTNTSTLLSIRYSNVIKSNERLTRSSSSSYLTNPIINQIISDAGTNGTGTVVYRMSEDAFKHIVEDEDGNFVLNKNVYAYYVIHSLETSFGASIYSHEDEDYYFELRRTDFNNYIRVPIGEITVYSELYLETKKLGIIDYEGYKTTYKIYVEVLPSSKVELLNVNVDGSNASFSFVDYIYTTDENEVFGKIYSVSQDHKVKSRDGLITLTFSITNCPDGYSIKDNLKIYYLNEDEDYEEVKLGEVYEVSGLTVNNGILNLTINMMQLAKGGYYRVDLMLYGTKVHYYQVEFLKDIGLEGSILDLKHSAMSNLTIASNENIVYSYIDLGVIPNLDVTPVLEGNDIKYYITLFNVNGTMIPSYLDSITLSPYANINAARLINIFVDGNHLITYTIEIDVEAESGEIYTWTHYITERSNKPFTVYKNGNPVSSKNVFAEREEYFTLFTIDLGFNNEYIDLSSIVIENIVKTTDFDLDYVEVENNLIYISFDQSVEPGNYTFNFVYPTNIIIGGFNVYREFPLINYHDDVSGNDITELIIVKKPGVNSLLQNVTFMPTDTEIKFPIIYNSKVMKICENDNGEMYYCDINNENIVITNELSFTKNGIVYRNIQIPVENYEFTVIGYVEDFNTDGLLPRFTLPLGAKIYRIDNGVAYGDGSVDHEDLRGNFMPDEDEDEKYVEYHVISEDGNYLTKYFIAVEDVNYTISFNLNISYQSGPNTITNIIDLMNNQDKLELFRDSGLVDEVMFIHFKNLSEAEPSYITSIDSIINQMTAIYRFNNLTSDGSGNEVSKSYYNYRFARNTGGTYSFELILPSGYAYQLEITDARGNEVVHGSLFEYENCFYVKKSVRPKTYHINIVIYKAEYAPAWGIVDRSISWK